MTVRDDLVAYMRKGIDQAQQQRDGILRQLEEARARISELEAELARLKAEQP